MNDLNQPTIVTLPVSAQGTLGSHFGRAAQMGVAKVVDGQLSDWQIHDVRWDISHDELEHGKHHANIVRFMKDHNVDRVAFGHMGNGMLNTLNKLGLLLIQVADPSQDAKQIAVEAAQLDPEASN